MKSMKTKSVSTLLAGLLLFTAAAVYAGGIQETESEAVSVTEGEMQKTGSETITVTDGFDREVTIKKPVKTVVTGLMVATETLIILGLEDKLVGIDTATANSEYETLYGDIINLPVVTDGSDSVPNYERLIELDPDLYITVAVPMGDFDEMASRLEPEIPIIAMSYDTPEQILSTIEMLGKIFDCKEAADEYIAFYQGTLDMIKERTADIPENEKVRVYYEGMPYFTFSKGLPAYHNHITIPGGINIAADMPQPQGAIDPEAVIGTDPDVIVSMAVNFPIMGIEPILCGYNEDDPSAMEAYYESIVNRPELAEVRAVKEGRVHVIMAQLPITSVIGFAYMAKWLYPERFVDLNPQAVHQEYLTRFLGADFDLDEHGVFVYPEH